MAFDVSMVFAAAAATTAFKFKMGLIEVLVQLLVGKLFGHEPLWNWTLLSVFTVSLILTSKRLHLCTPERISNTLNEHRLSLQACFTAGLVLTGTLYLDKAVNVPRAVVLVTVGLVTVLLGVRRLLYRLMLHHRYDRGVGTRNAGTPGSLVRQLCFDGRELH